MSVGPTELILIALVVFLLFGTRRLADLGKGLGEGIRNFKHGLSGDGAASSKEDESTEPPKQLNGRVASPEELAAGKTESAGSYAEKPVATTETASTKQKDPTHKA